MGPHHEVDPLSGSDPPDVPDALRTALADRYALTQELGRGGMATVYLARDVRHGRLVAVKVLRQELAASLGTKRFLREIEITARLNHPHIVPIHDSGDAAGVLYYVMPLVEGESLRDRLNRERQLPIDDALQIVRDAADALGHAHSLGIVHRDIKPENILLAGGHAMVADFGIARAVVEAGGEKLTETGIAVGTPMYMSPEQALGREQVDARSDVYSLACVLYEMLAGDPPFTGSNPQAVLARKSLEQPPRLATVRETVPPAVEHVVLRALARVPADRFATVAQFVDALAKPGPIPPAGTTPDPARGRPWKRLALAGIPAAVLAVGWLVLSARPDSRSMRSVAVLPCENLSRDSAQEYVSDRVTEELIQRLAMIQQLGVQSWLSVQQYRTVDRSPRDVAAELNAASLVRCLVDQSSDSVRLEVQLIDVESGAIAWSQAYERLLTVANVDDVERTVALEIARTLGVDVSGDDRARLGTATTRDMEALTLFRLGRHFWETRTADGLAKSIDYYEQAIARDSTFAAAYVALAEVKGFMLQAASLPPRDVWPEMGRLLRRALALDPFNAEGHAWYGTVLLYRDWDWQGAEREFRRAVELDPNSARPHLWYGQVLSYTGRHDEAVAALRRARDLEPTHPFIASNLAERLRVAGQYRDALREARHAAELDRNDWVAWWMMATSYLALGQRDSAVAAHETAVGIAGESDLLVATVGHTYGRAGRPDGAERSLATLRRRAEERYVPPAYFALLHASLGRADSALDWLERAVDDRGPEAVWYLGDETLFPELREHPRFVALRDRMGFDRW